MASDAQPLLHSGEQRYGSSSTGAQDGNEVAPSTLDSDAVLRVQGHRPEMEPSFSPLAALGLGFSYVGQRIRPNINSHVIRADGLSVTASPIPGSAT